METADLALIGNILTLMGRYAEAHPYLEQSLQQAEQSGQPLELIDALFGLGALAYYEKGEDGLLAAAPVLARLWSMLKDTLFHDWIAYTTALYAIYCALTGDRVGALDFIERALEAVDKNDTHAPNEDVVRLWVFRALKMLGETERARTVLLPSYEWIDQTASKIEDETLRRSWVENVPYNRQVIEAWMQENA